MPIDSTAIGAVTDPAPYQWTDRDTMLYALGVGAGTDDLPYITDNSHDIAQQVLPTFAVICCSGFAAATKVGSFNWGMLLHGSQEIRLHAPLPASGELSVVSEVAYIQDKGQGKNAIIVMRGKGTDPATGELIAETLSTAVIRGEGGFGGQPGQRPVAPEFPDREPDARIADETRGDQALIYRLSGDRNPLHSDPWFAREAHRGRRAVLGASLPRRDVDHLDLANRAGPGGVPHRGQWTRRLQHADRARRRYGRVHRLIRGTAAPADSRHRRTG